MRLLYTWIDIDFIFEQLRLANTLPDWIVGTSTYTDGLLLRVVKGTERSNIDEFLAKEFGARYEPGVGLLLEGTPDKSRPFAVDVEEIEAGERLSDTESALDVRPTFSRMAAVPERPDMSSLPRLLPPDSPELVAFYSFKGGVGRTTHLLAYLRALSARQTPARALVIDADLEAPGITALLQHDKSFGPVQFSFVDLLALAQSDSSPDFGSTLSIAGYATRKQVLALEAGGGYAEHYFLPAFRSEAQAMRLDIRPEHLIARPGKAWVLSELLALLGKQLQVDTILIDLRAGYSELASPLLFDPRVHRILVTTPSGQALDGTMAVLGQLAKIAPPASRPDYLDPTAIVSFVVPELLGTGALNDVSTSLLEKYPDAEVDVDLPRLRVEYTTFAQDLLYIASVTDAIQRLAGTTVARVMGQFAAAEVPEPVPPRKPGEVDLPKIRSVLTELATELEYAESGRGNRFLKIAPLRALARQFSDTVPIAVVIGSKGSGKTYTCLQTVRSKLWSEFVREAGGNPAQHSGFIWPVFQSKNLGETANRIVNECRGATAAALNASTVLSGTAIFGLVQESLRHTTADETWWRHRWFKIIANSLGIQPSTENESAGLIVETLRRTEKQLVVVFDGLEELFPVLDSNNVQKIALRALIQDVPNYLRESPNCPLGLVVFVRADLAHSAIPQNYGQFARLYEQFALRWNAEEALRLAVWLSSTAGLPVEVAAPAELMSADEAKDALVLLWGRKLGAVHSREARSSEWVIAALSDFRGQIQARDLVRFLRHAAGDRRNTAVEDRVLAPRAVRDAILPCSTEKIEEIKEEIPQLKTIFARLEHSTDRRIPFDSASSGLSVEEIRFLQAVGVLMEDHGEYFMPEIFRLGLGFQLREGKRPRVLSLARRVVS
jgi:cellulose biosynthesis protein BcsQ